MASRLERGLSSALATDALGRPITVVTSPTIVELPVGMVFRDVGNTFVAGEAGLGWLGHRYGRAPTPAEQAAARAPYSSTGSRKSRARVVDDDDLDERMALELCRLEQERSPVDLITAVANP
jgi:hypothetical protein